MDECNQLCSSGWPSYVAKTLTFNIMRNLFHHFFSYLPCVYAPLTGFIFSHTFELTRMKFDVVLKQFKLNIVTLCLSEICRMKGKNSCFTDYVKKLQCWHAFRRLWTHLVKIWCGGRWYQTLYFDSVSDQGNGMDRIKVGWSPSKGRKQRRMENSGCPIILVPQWSTRLRRSEVKWSEVTFIDNMKFYILILAKVTLTSIQCHRSTRKNKSKQKFCTNYLTNFPFDLGGIECSVQTYWSDKCHFDVLLPDQHSGDRIILD